MPGAASLSDPIAHGPPWLVVHPLFDGDSYELNDFFELRNPKLGKASRENVFFIGIGNPRQHDEWYARQRGPTRAASDEQDAERYAFEVQKLGSERLYRLREMERLAEMLKVPPEELPCLVFRTTPAIPPYPRLGIKPHWYSTPGAQKAFSEALREWLGGPKLAQLFRERKTVRCLLDELQPQLDSVFRSIEERVGEVLGREVPAPSGSLPNSRRLNIPGLVCFPTPENAAWKDVRIRFVDGHTVSVRILERSGVYNYTQMQMHNRKNGAPTVQWNLLRDLADERGNLAWQSKHADRKLKKRKQLLAERLRAFFGIEGDPFELTPNRKGWETRFVISPDADPEDE